MSSIESAPATIPSTSEATFNRRVRALVRRHAQMLIGQIPQPGPLSEGDHRNQTPGRHKIRIIERHRRPTKGVRESHPRGALPG